jgi:zinc transport system ATP-binding protein
VATQVRGDEQFADHKLENTQLRRSLMPSSAAIELRSVSLSFGEKVVISHVSFRLEPGNTLFLLGPNGSGKSVLLKLIIGLLKPDNG